MTTEAKGVVVPMVSPFNGEGKIDEIAAIKLVDHVVSKGCHPFVLGTTGEALSITAAERLRYLKAAVRANEGRAVVYAGIASLCLEDSILAAKQYADEGAEILVANLPSYYPLQASQMQQYFTELADEVPLPLMIYNITATTHMSIPVDLVRELSKHPNIIGLKDSERDEERLDTLMAFARGIEDFYYQLGWAAQSVYALKAGADGIVPSTANAFPGFYYELYEAVMQGRLERANELQELTNELSAIYQKGRLLSQALPGLKVMLREMGICETHGIAPCYPLSPEDEQLIVHEMKRHIEKMEG